MKFFVTKSVQISIADISCTGTISSFVRKSVLDSVWSSYCMKSVVMTVIKLCIGNVLCRWSGPYLWSNWCHESQHLELTTRDSDSCCLQLSVLEHIKVRLDVTDVKLLYTTLLSLCSFFCLFLIWCQLQHGIFVWSSAVTFVWKILFLFFLYENEMSEVLKFLCICSSWAFNHFHSIIVLVKCISWGHFLLMYYIVYWFILLCERMQNSPTSHSSRQRRGNTGDWTCTDLWIQWTQQVNSNKCLLHLLLSIHISVWR